MSRILLPLGTLLLIFTLASCSGDHTSTTGPVEGLRVAGRPVLSLRQYKAEALVPPGTSFHPRFINDLNQVAGTDNFGGIRLWEEGVVTPLSIPGGLKALNNRGVILTQTHLYDTRSGALTDLNTLGLLHFGAADLNDLGQVVGNFTGPAGEARLFLWEAGVLTDLGAPVHGPFARDINNVGQILFTAPTAGQGHIGLHPYIWDNGTVTLVNLEFPLPVVFLEAQGINDLGQVFGHVSDGGPFETVFIWQDGSTEFLNGLSEDSIYFNYVRGFNDTGDLVGESMDVLSISSPVYPYIWRRGRMFALETPNGGDGAAFDVNNTGAIVGESRGSGGGPTLWVPGRLRPAPPR